jgi:hypothetical protein
VAVSDGVTRFRLVRQVLVLTLALVLTEGGRGPFEIVPGEGLAARVWDEAKNPDPERAIRELARAENTVGAGDSHGGASPQFACPCPRVVGDIAGAFRFGVELLDPIP